jgi:hypothetical protein
MRRVSGLVLTGLGAILFVLALLSRFVVAGDVVKFPLTEHSVSVLLATNASYFSTANLQEETGATLRDTVTVTGDSAAGTSSRAVWSQVSSVYDVTDSRAVQTSAERLAFDRRTAKLISCCGTAIGARSGIHVSGLGYVWPPGARKSAYQLFDTTLLRPVPAVYAGTAVVDGLTTYKYVETVPATRFGTRTLPGSLAGLTDGQPVTLAEYDQSVTTEFVDPATGSPVRYVSSQHLYLADSSGSQVLNLMNARFTTEPASVAGFVRSAKSKDVEISVVSVILPAVLALVGIIVLAMGVILILSRRGYEYDDDDPYAASTRPAASLPDPG